MMKEKNKEIKISLNKALNLFKLNGRMRIIAENSFSNNELYQESKWKSIFKTMGFIK